MIIKKYFYILFLLLGLPIESMAGGEAPASPSTASTLAALVTNLLGKQNAQQASGNPIDQKQKDNLDAIVARANQVVANLPTFFENLERRKQQKQAAEQAKLDESYKRENTQLARLGPLVLTNKDMVNLATTHVEMGADRLMYQKLEEIHTDLIVADIIENCEDLIQIFLDLHEADRNWQENYDKLSMLQRAFINKQVDQEIQYLGRFKEFFRTRHACIGSNPFTEKTIGPLLVRFFAQRVTSGVSDGLLVGSHMPANACQAYKYNSQTRQSTGVNGVITVSQITNILKWFACPSVQFNKLAAQSQVWWLGKTLSFFAGTDYEPESDENGVMPEKTAIRSVDDKINTILGTRFFDIRPFKMLFTMLTSKNMERAIEFVTLGLAVKLYDSQNAQAWAEYAVNNRQELASLIVAYKTARDTFADDAVLADLKVKITDFVKKSYQATGWFSQGSMRKWWATQRDACIQAASWAGIPLMAFGAYQGYQFYKTYLSGLGLFE